MSDEPSSLVLFLISAGVITLFLVFLWGVNKVATWRRAPKSESPDRGETHPRRRRGVGRRSSRARSRHNRG